jgi:cyclopropane fatty-acyl-phospholipid synthase-like methyltransferase
MIKLNLGCALDIKSGYHNIDIFDHPSVIKMDVRNLNYKDLEVDEIYAKDVLEHVSYVEAEKCIKEWSRVLKTGGKIFIQTLNLDLFISAVNLGIWNIDVLNHMLFAGINWSGQEPNQYDFHKCIFNLQKIESVLNKNNIKIIEFRNDSVDDLIGSPYLHNLNMFITGVKL